MVYFFYSTAPIVNSSVICFIVPKKSTLLRQLIQGRLFVIHSMEVPLRERDYLKNFLDHSNYVKTIQPIPDEYTNRTGQIVDYMYKYIIKPLPSRASFNTVGDLHADTITLLPNTFTANTTERLLYLDDSDSVWKYKSVLNYITANQFSYSLTNPTVNLFLTYQFPSTATPTVNFKG